VHDIVHDEFHFGLREHGVIKADGRISIKDYSLAIPFAPGIRPPEQSILSRAERITAAAHCIRSRA
jgi:hypothetical protein